MRIGNTKGVYTDAIEYKAKLEPGYPNIKRSGLWQSNLRDLIIKYTLVHQQRFFQVFKGYRLSVVTNRPE